MIRKPLTRRDFARTVMVGSVALGSAMAVGTTASAREVDRYLDLAAVNADAEAAGGLHPTLPSDSAKLRVLLDEARSAGVDPRRYQVLLKQYWLAVGTESAGIDLASWTPFDGVHANLGNLTDTFAFYERLQLEHSELQWAGMGGMVGPAFAAGLLDVDFGRVVLNIRAISDAMAVVWRELDRVGTPIAQSIAAPEDLQALLQVGHEIRPEDVMWFQGKVIAMSKHIFSDLIPMHMAWIHNGADGISELDRAGLLDENARIAWRNIASGNPEAVFDGNVRLLRREQYQSVGDQWDEAKNYRGSVGRALTYLTTFAASPSMPGVIPPRESDSLEFQVGAARIATPLPDFNWADRDGRWIYITNQLLPVYRDLMNDQPVLWRETLSAPVSQRIAGQGMIAQLPELLRSMLSAVKIDWN